MPSLFLAVGILKSSTFSIHQHDNIRGASRDLHADKRQWLDVTPTQALPHNGVVTRDTHRNSIRLETNHHSMSSGLRSRSRDSDKDYVDLIPLPPRIGETSSSTHTPSTHNSSQGVAGI